MATQKKMPGWIHWIFATLTVLALVPPFVIYRARYAKSTEPRVHPIPDMDNMDYYEAQSENVAFADKRAMRLPVAGTVARGELREDDHFYRGKVNGAWAQKLPAADPETKKPLLLDQALLERGRARYNIYCSPCHGYDGTGTGLVALRGRLGSEASFVAPTDLHKVGKDSPVEQPDGQMFNTITNGLRTMPPYGPQIPPRDRWAIVAYVRALQRSQAARPEDVPQDEFARKERWPRY
ncbi:MAG: c-type cytochrome [Planctomycetes bacterium]|nr:c-type cytochrome [Planctomycetota bacterium]